MEEHHTHWAVGWVDGYAIRVYRRGRITKAFRTCHDLQSRLADYPVLDEDDYSNRVYEATLENIADAAWRLKREYDLPVGLGVSGLSLAVGPRLLGDREQRRPWRLSERTMAASGFAVLGFKRTEEE